jgi:hypothetical protein
LAMLVRSDPVCANMGFVLTTSGSENENLTAFQATPGTALMSKPFDAKKLAIALAEATGRCVADRQ